MRTREFKHENEPEVKSHSSVFVMCFLCVFLCAAALGTLRLYGLYLEHRISETASRIEVCREKNLHMTKRYSELLSPARIYSHAREDLGMINAENIRVVKLDVSSVMVAQAAVTPQEVQRASFFAQINPFVRTAHAND
ncbi:hypothetical protein LJC40_07015 [Synergistaceae bacterium OttesenSCG-928-D05]|nr:hypothetical protein [Synergistaceae bacterium OttesenSCG-928-D05]